MAAGMELWSSSGLGLCCRRRDGCGVVSCKYATEALGRELFPLASLPGVCQRSFAQDGSAVEGTGEMMGSAERERETLLLLLFARPVEVATMPEPRV